MMDPMVAEGNDDLPLDPCDALLICLNNNRFVIAWHDRPRDLWPINGGWKKLRRLKPGDEVIYKGDRAIVRAIDVYR